MLVVLVGQAVGRRRVTEPLQQPSITFNFRIEHLVSWQHAHVEGAP